MGHGRFKSRSGNEAGTAIDVVGLGEVEGGGPRISKFGGALVYVPCPDRKARDERIRQMFNGTNLQEVCEQFGLSRTAVYRICSRRK